MKDNDLEAAAAGADPSPGRCDQLPDRWDLDVDQVSLGSSSGGLLAAMVGHDSGMSTAVLEATDLLGGGTARSNGGMWIPLTGLQRELGFSDSRQAAQDYIRATSMGRHDEDKLAAFLDSGTHTVDYVNRHTPLRIVGSPDGDYYDHLPDSRAGRLVWPDLAVAAKLFRQSTRYPLLEHVRTPPVPMPVGGQAGVTDGLGGGNALIGGLVAGCMDRAIPVLRNTRAMQLIFHRGRVVGVKACTENGDYHVRARRAVLIATGGYEFNAALNRQFIPYPERIYPVTAPGNRGDGHLMGMAAGAALAMMDSAVWMAAIPTPGEQDWGIGIGNIGGGTAFGYPGVIFVNRDGKRVCDEGFYPAVSRAIFAQQPVKESAYANLPLFWVMDQGARDTYGFGPLAPGDNSSRPWFFSADTLGELAAKAGIDPTGLEATVARYNHFAAKGLDPDFGRGQDRTNDIVRRERARVVGEGAEQDTDYVWGRLGALEKPPYYAARLGLGSVGHRGGLVTDPHARVISAQGHVIAGLYATSNAAAHLAVGAGYSSGQSIALSLVFGYVAARHVAASEAPSSREA